MVWQVCVVLMHTASLATHPRVCKVHSCMSGLPVTFRAGASLLGRWLLPRVRWQRRADISTYVVPRTLSSYSNRTFAATGSRLLNSIPVQLHSPDITYGLLRRQLKGHLFREAWTRRSVTSDMRRLRKTLTYLRHTRGFTTVHSINLLCHCHFDCEHARLIQFCQLCYIHNTCIAVI